MLELGLTDVAFRAKLAAFVAETGLDDPREWTRRIVVDRANWPLSFHRWPLRESHGDRGRPASRSVNWASPGSVTSPSTPTIRCCGTWTGQPFLRRRAAGTEPASGQLRGRSPDPRQHPGAGPVQRADRLRGLRPHRRRRLGQAVHDGPEPVQGHLREAARRWPGTGLALRPDPAAGRRRESPCPVEPDDTRAASGERERALLRRPPADGDDDLDDMLAARRGRDPSGRHPGAARVAVPGARRRPRLAGRPVPVGRLEGAAATAHARAARVVRPARSRGDPALPRARGHPAADARRSGARRPLADAGGRLESQPGPFRMNWTFPQPRPGP